MDVIVDILMNISSCRCLLLCDVIMGILKEEMDLASYVIVLGKSHLWSCRHKNIKPSCSHFKRILKNKYETENTLHWNLKELVLFVTNGKNMNCF